MSRDRYAESFARLAEKGEGAFVPFTVLGDPDAKTSLEVLRAMAAGGADMLELGIPFSDPVADGPTIQAADIRALKAGITPPAAFDIIREFRSENDDIPIGLLVYANLVHEPGLVKFYEAAADAGVDSILVADVPLEESAPFRWVGEKTGVGHVSMATPLTDDARLAETAKFGGPYLYVVSRLGVTGRDASLAKSAKPLLRRIRTQGGPPTLLGFGISKPDHVRQAIAAGADGAISGSAVVEIVARHGRGARRRMAAEIKGFVELMKRATRPKK